VEYLLLKISGGWGDAGGVVCCRKDGLEKEGGLDVDVVGRLYVGVNMENEEGVLNG